MHTTTRMNTMARTTTANKKYGSSVVFPIKEEASTSASTSASSSDYDFDPQNSTLKRIPSLSLDFRDSWEDKRQFYGISLHETTQGKSGKPTIALSPTMNGLSSPQMLKFQSAACHHCDKLLTPSSSSSHSSQTNNKDHQSSSSSSTAPPLSFLADGG
jgi:hypothetical protein